MYLYFLYPKLDKPILLYKHQYFSIWNLTSSIKKPYSNSIHPYFHTNIHSSIPVFFFFLSFFHLFFSLLLLLLLFLPFSKTKNEIFIFVFSLFDLIPFLFDFPRRKLPPSFLQATCLFHKFSSLFHSNIFLLLPFCPHFHFFYSQTNLSKSYFGI